MKICKRIRVSATSANIGAGFDCMGLALNLYNEIIISPSEKKLVIETDKNLPRDETNMVYTSMRKVFDLCGKTQNVHIKQINNIPVASGLGSSAACVVAGVVAANEMLDKPLNEQEIVDLCTSMDGHPDNVVPAIKGGVTAGVIMDGHVEYIKCNAPESLVLYAATPDFELKTSFSRSVLPLSYSREDVVYSLSRAIVTFAALVNGDIEMLKIIDDKLHQPYRKPLIKGYSDICEIFESHGAISHFLSGAGPTIIGLFRKETKISLPQNWTCRKLNIVNSGVQVFEI